MDLTIIITKAVMKWEKIFYLVFTRCVVTGDAQIMINNILNGNCLDLMDKIESQSVDMILCDLPYGLTAPKWDANR